MGQGPHKQLARIMTLLIFICNQPDMLEEVLEGFVEVGITGATVIDTVGMGQILSSEVPIFAGFRSMFRGASTVNKTIFSVIDEREKVRDALDIIDEILGGLNDPGKGIAFTVPIENVRGLAPEFE
jgi:nitrogen regulatory protein P-II 1